MTNSQLTRNMATQTMVSLFSGVSLGFLDHFASQTGIYDFDTTPAFWLVLVTFISVMSATPRRAAYHSSLLLYSMLFSYYISYFFSYGFVPARLVLLWGAVSFLLSVYGWVIWHVRITSALGALPIAFLLQSGQYFIPDLWNAEARAIRLTYLGLDWHAFFTLVAAIGLFIWLSRLTKRPFYLLLMTTACYFLIRYIPISYHI